MIKILIILLVIGLGGCGGTGSATSTVLNQTTGSETSSDSNQTTETEPKKYIILSNDYWDTDNANYALLAVWAKKQGYKVLLLQTEYAGDLINSNILSIYDQTIPFGVSKNSNDRALPLSKADKALIKAGYTHSLGSDAYTELDTYLESVPDKSVRYVMGGKFVFLSQYLSDPYRLELFILKVKSLYIGLGCDITINDSCKDFNLAMNQKSWSATVNVYNQLHGKVPYVVGKINPYPFPTVFNLFKNSSGIYKPLKIIWGNGTYRNYGEIDLGDIDSAFPALEIVNYVSQKGQVVLGNKRFNFIYTNNKNDLINIINDDVNGIMGNIIKELGY